MTSARTVALLGLAFGIYLLGIATALLLIRFNEYPDAWKHYATALLAGFAMLFIGASVASILKGNRTPVADPSDSGSIRADKIESTAESTPCPAHRESPPGTSQPPGPVQAQIGESGSAPDEDVPGRLAQDPALEGREGEPRPGIPTTSSSPPETIKQNERQHDPPVSAEVHEADLISVWEVYRREGDGHFTAQGLQERLNARNFGASVREHEHLGERDCLLLVDTPSRSREFYVLPSFTKSPRKVSKWFDDHSDGALTGRIEKVLKVAEGRWTEDGMLDTIKKGIVA